jgi:hypothetical protein
VPAALAREYGADLSIVVFGHELVKQVFVREEFDLLHPTVSDGRAQR